MGNEKVLYFPYRTHYYFALALAWISFAFCVAIGYSLSNPEWVLLIPILFVSAVLMLSKFLYDTSKISVLLADDGLWVVGKGKMDMQFYAWCDITYLFHTRSKRGQRFVVLSDEDISKNQLAEYVAQSANHSNPCISPTVVVLPVDPLQDTTALLNLLNNKVSILKKGQGDGSIVP